MNNLNNVDNLFTIKATMKKLIFISFGLLIGSVSLNAQGNLGNEQINVVKAYQPMLSDAFKISDIPTRDTAVMYVPDMKYEVSPEKYPTVYTISPIKPLRIKDENIKKLYRGFVKGGYGTKNTPYVELFYNSLRSKKFDAGIHLHHISSSGKIKGYGHPGMNESGVKLSGARFFDNIVLEGGLGYNRSLYHYYGYNSPPDKFSKSSTRHSFDDVFGEVKLRGNEHETDRIKFAGGVSFYNFSDNRSNDENNFIFNGSLMNPFDGFEFGANIGLDFLKLDARTLKSENNTIIRIDPRFVKEFDRMKLTAGANIPVEISDLTRYHFYPHLRLDFKLIEETFSAFGQLTGNLERNSYKIFSRENPFIGRPLMLRNSNNKLDVSAGVNIKLDKQLAFLGSIGLQRMNDDAFYQNVDTTSTLVMYGIMYDNNTRTNIHAEIVFDQGDKMEISIAADYFGNKPSREDKALFRPDFKFSVQGRYVISEKIYAHAQIGYVTPRYYIQYNGPFFADEYKSLKGYFDGNIQVDYRYSKVLSVFAHLSNVTASKYQRWHNYPSYGFGAMAGLSYSF
jgi:hypothetical protein